jgi:transcriptional regulator with XRE-family HTH domain
MRIAERIKQIRHESVVSIEDFAAKTGLAKSLIARLENGQAVPTLEMLEDLADAAGVPVYRFFFDDVQLVRTPKLTPRVTWKELLEGRELEAVPIPLSKKTARSRV